MGSVKIYTKAGDAGETGLFDGALVPKSDPRVDAYGEVDELNAWLGLVRAQRPEEDLDTMLLALQRGLFAVGAALADPRKKIAARVEKTVVTADDIAGLEGWLDRLGASLPPLRRLVLAGGAPGGAMLHVARTVCRRAERRIVSLGAQAVDPVVLAYVNRCRTFCS
jgi:cob(I)alamin adenosyltransferase